jgi:hypothetical protein
MRDVIHSMNLISIKKIFFKFDISGDTKEPIFTSSHPVIGGSCDIFEVQALDIEVPYNLEFSPVLTTYCYDNGGGFLGNRLLGVTNIDLRPHCEKILN